MKLTETGSAYFRVFKNNVEISKHNEKHKAIEAAINLELENPKDDIRIHQILELRVEHEVVTPPVPTPTPVLPIPEPDPVPPSPPLPTSPPTAIGFFSQTSVYYAGVQQFPKHSKSDAIIQELVRNSKLAWGGAVSCESFSNGLWEADSNTPVVTVRRIKNGQTISFQARIPLNFKPAAGEDAHGCIIDRVAGHSLEMWAMEKDAQGWTCRDRGIVKLGGDGILRDVNGDWNSATASHIPICTRPITKKELEDYAAGKIKSAGHMIGLALNEPAVYPGFKHPAQSNSDGNNNSPNAIVYGQVLRFPANYTPPASHPVLLRCIADTCKYDGCVVMDVTGSGAAFYVQDPQQFGMDEVQMLKPYIGGYIQNPGGDEWIQFYKLFGDATNPSIFEWGKMEAVA